MKTKLTELYGISVHSSKDKLKSAVESENCPFLSRKCLKNRKSIANDTIGTCSIGYGKGEKSIIICPHRFINKKKIFFDCLHLLAKHQPGYDVHVIPEITVPGGSVDYIMTTSHKGKVKDFVGIELQGLDTTGTVYPGSAISQLGDLIEARRP